MKKLLLMLTAALLLLSLCACVDGAADTDTDAGTDAANTADETKNDGEVSDITDDGIPRETAYRLLSKEEFENGDAVTSLKYGYDKKGRLTYIRKENKTEPFLTVAYGDDGIVSEIVDASKMKIVKQMFENGRLVFVGGYVGGVLIESGEYEYDEEGRIISDTAYSEEGEVVRRNEYRYEKDEKGNVTAQYEVYADRDVLYIKYAYDEDGNCIKEEHYYGNDEVNAVIYYEYDENGNQTSYSQYSAADGEMLFVARIEYEYTSDGDIKTETQYNRDENGDMSAWMTREYEYANGYKTSVSEFYADNDFVESTETYEYDDAGNLTARIFVYYQDGAIGYELKTANAYREFFLTQEEIAANETNDAIIREYVSGYAFH